MSSTIEKDNLIHEIGGLILQDSQYTDKSWQSLSLVGTFANGRKNMVGYRYFDDGSVESRTPDNFDVLDKLIDLQELMTSEKGEPWKQCLLHITQPDLSINIQFEYDDAKRWSLGKVTLDTAGYAESLRPVPEQT